MAFVTNATRSMKLKKQVHSRTRSSQEWQMSTNGAEFTRDFAARSIITRIRKQPEGFVYKRHLAGDVFAHITANQPYYLGCVFAVIKVWVGCGKLCGGDNRHDFRIWCQSLDWIVRNFFKLPALLNGHQEEQTRTGNPSMQWLRDLAHGAIKQGLAGKALTATGLVEVSDEAGLTLPGRADSKAEPNMRVGQVLSNLFKTAKVADELVVDGIKVRRVVRGKINPENRKENSYREYTFFTEGGPVTGA